MTVIYTVIQFVVFLGLLLFFHEFGHFIVSRLFKIEVEEFGFGLPPRIKRLFVWKGTEFTLNWIPFGAFVRPKGENDPDVPGGLSSASPWVRLAVLLAGPGMNILIGLLIFAFSFMAVGRPNASIVKINLVAPNTPAQQVGLQAGDVIVQVNQTKIDSMEKLQQVVKDNIGQEISMTYNRNKQDTTVQVTPRVNPPEGQGALGIQLGIAYEPISLGEAWSAAFAETINQGKSLILLPVHLIQGQITPAQARLVGLPGIYQIYQEAGQIDSQSGPTGAGQGFPLVRLTIIAAISIALGLTNLLPIPALDGGRILFLLPELLLRKRVPARYENMVHMVGLVVLLILMVYVTVDNLIHPIVLP